MSDTPNTIGAAELAIIERLRSLITDRAVEGFPDAPAKWRSTHQQGTLLVGYAGSSDTDETTDDIAVTARRMLFDVLILTRGLGNLGQQGAETDVERVRVALAGFVIPGFDMLIPLSDRCLVKDEGEWMFSVRFQTTTFAVVPGDDPDATAALLSRVTAISPFDTIEVDAP